MLGATRARPLLAAVPLLLLGPAGAAAAAAAAADGFAAGQDGCSSDPGNVSLLQVAAGGRQRQRGEQAPPEECGSFEVQVSHSFKGQERRNLTEGVRGWRDQVFTLERVPEFLLGSLYIAGNYNQGSTQVNITTAAPRAEVCIIAQVGPNAVRDGGFSESLPNAGFTTVNNESLADGTTLIINDTVVNIDDMGIWCKDVPAGTLQLPRSIGQTAMGIAVLFFRCSDVPEVCTPGTELAPGAMELFGGTEECCCVPVCDKFKGCGAACGDHSVLVHHDFAKQRTRAPSEGHAEDVTGPSGSDPLPLEAPQFLRGNLYATYYKPSRLDDLKVSVKVAAPKAKVCVVAHFPPPRHGRGAFVTALPRAGFKMVTDATTAANETREIRSGPWEPIDFVSVWCKEVSAGTLHLPRPYGVVAMGVAVLFIRCYDVPEVCPYGTVLAPDAKYLLGGTPECCCVRPTRAAGALASSG